MHYQARPAWIAAASALQACRLPHWHLTLWAMATAGMLLIAVPANASTITFTLDCTLESAACTPGGPFGTVALADNGDDIEVTVDLVSAKATALSLNWYTNMDPGGAWSATGAGLFVFITDGSNPFFRFDIRIPDSVPHTNPWTFTLSHTILNLDPSNFLFKDELNQVYVGVEADIFARTWHFGAQTATVPEPVPEPATLTFVGLGLLELARRAWWRRRTAA